MERPPSSFTGRSRTRKTTFAVKAGDVVAKTLITIGGIATILAVTLVCAFLLYVSIPLFKASSTDHVSSGKLQESQAPVSIGVDEFQTIAWAYYQDGTMVVSRLDNGDVIKTFKPFGAIVPTASTFSAISSEAAFGFADGTVTIASLNFSTEFINPESHDDKQIQSLGRGVLLSYDGGIAQLLQTGQVRVQRFDFKTEDPIPAMEGTGIKRIDFIRKTAGVTLLVLGDNDQMLLEEIGFRTNILTRKVTVTKEVREIPYKPGNRGTPLMVATSGLGDNVYVIWPDGAFLRYDTRVSVPEPKLMEEIDLLPGSSDTITSLKFLIGKSTLIVGDSAGNLTAWFPAKPADAKAEDGVQMMMAHKITGTGSPVTKMANSSRGRLIAAGYADGHVKLYFVTSQKLLTDVVADQGKPIVALALTPKDDGLIAMTDTTVNRWNINPGHPETTVHSLFMPVWYEGYAKPERVWQSVGGTDDFESKYGMVPLIFGTIKATVYSLMFGVPIAILAAIYTSEFLNPKTKGRIKPVVETMASLPSVVLGFVAGLVIAPLVEEVVPAMIACLLTVPVAFLFGAYIWQLIPYKTGLFLQPYRFMFTFICLPVGLAMGWFLGPVIEDLLFGGNLKLWLDFKNHAANLALTDSPMMSGMGGWAVIFFPVCAVAAAVAISQVVNPQLRERAAGWSRQTAALMDIVKFFAGLAATLISCFVIAWIISKMGFDPRGSFVDTYVQKNSLVVGFVMGFAIIPIIYTLSEDALSSVPDHLRSASLGAGATPWQTTVRIVLPTAMSGIFSAVMIGVGRAVGETMIVLMAAGNTPVMDWNIFSGFRTLSANIAVELPEAVKDSTHYRVLFLAALVLFAMTFVLNTVAEIVRQRFRKRAYQL